MKEGSLITALVIHMFVCANNLFAVDSFLKYGLGVLSFGWKCFVQRLEYDFTKRYPKTAMSKTGPLQMAITKF